ncbi:hypothetical protein [Micromonospora sp. NPDC049891]|uniref:hypothetical protein n=1 Tax=Micromonospora sp. NPDC049891 TaxID=3155655 RepID=UPI0033D1B12F
MTRPRRHQPEQAREAWRIRDEARPMIDAVEETRDEPGRLVRSPCDDRTCPTCWGTPEEAEHRRRTGLPVGHPSAAPPRPEQHGYVRRDDGPQPWER